LGAALDTETAVGRCLLEWPGDPVADGLALRLVGGIHALAHANRIAAVSELVQRDDPEHSVAAVLAQHDAALLPWLENPPQTNEPGRSAGLMAGLLVLAARHGLPFDLLEIGSSAGLNLLIDRFGFDLGGVTPGPAEAPVQIRPDWTGPPPPRAKIDFASLRGVDQAPLDVTHSGVAQRLLSYIWPDQPQRIERVRAAITMQRDHPVDLVQDDAADWVEARLAEPQAPGTMRVVMHSLVWQYLGDERQARITSAIEAAGSMTTADVPLGWVILEADRTLNAHELVVRSWPGHGEPVRLANPHAHGFWMEWLGAD